MQYLNTVIQEMSLIRWLESFSRYR